MLLIGVSTLMTSAYTCYNHVEVSHYNPRTLEDVLQDLITEYDRLDDLGMTQHQRDELFAEYTDKIRGMVD